MTTTWFVSRHSGALDWMQRNGPPFDRHVTHLNVNEIEAGDTVIGTLPVNLAAEICARGARYWHLSLLLAPADRGQELSADQLTANQATLEPYFVRKA